MELKPTNHRYYCSDHNYYVNGYSNFGRCDYETWNDFKQEWYDHSYDDDLNHLFRFDICERDEHPGVLSLWLFFILQRKGIFTPVFIKEITESDMAEIEEFLRGRWEYLKRQWSEFSTTEEAI